MFWLVNEIQNIADKKYLELGIYDATNFNLVNAKVKHGVDISSVGNPTFNMSTDDFFAKQFGEKEYDAIYIDACHHYLNVWRDYNDSICRLSKNGLILCHDFIPPTEEGTLFWQSGDAYKFFAAIIDFTPTVKFYSANAISCLQGLTLITNPQKVEYVPNKYASLSFTDFMAKIQNIRRYSVAELISIVKRFS